MNFRLKIFIYVIVTAFTLSFSGCRTYYKVKNTTNYTAQNTVDIREELKKILDLKKTIFITQGNSEWTLESPKLNTSTLEGKIVKLPSTYTMYGFYDFKNKRENGLHFNTTNAEQKEFAIGQAHIHLKDNLALKYGDIDEIPINEIIQIDNYIPNRSKNIARKVPIFFIALGGAAVVGLFYAIATACNCPYLYIQNKDSYEFKGTMFGGAIYKSVERADFMPLNIDGYIGDELNLKIINQKKEHQFTNYAKLLLVNHPENTKVLLDKDGGAHTLEKPEFPISAISSDNKNYLQELTSKDSVCYSFKDFSRKNELSGITLAFKKPVNAKTGKLVLNAKNSDWSAYIYNEFCKLLGNKHEEWAGKNAVADGKKLIEGSVKQGVQISVYAKVKNEWKYINYFDVVGSIFKRDIVMPLNLEEITGDTVQIMLKSAFLNWDIDMASMDFSENKTVTIKEISPVSVTDSLGNDYTKALLNDDSLYIKHYNINDYVKVKFKLPEANNNLKQSVIFNSKGYYNRLDKYTGKPDYKALNKIRKTGGYSEFSRKKYLENIQIYYKKNTLVKN